MDKRKIRWKRTATYFIHKETWRVVDRQFNRPKDPKKGVLYDDLVAMVFTYHTLEGYLNFLGELILPDEWQNERTIRGGLTGKLNLILAQCDLPAFDKGRRPYATLRKLKRLRDEIAHPKIIVTKAEKIYSISKDPPLFHPSYLENLVSHELALRARDDVKFIIDCIHTAAIGKFPGKPLGDDGLGGILHHGSDSGSLIMDEPET